MTTSTPTPTDPTAPERRPEDPPPPTARAWGVLAVLCGAIFLEGVDVAMLNVALPSIRTDLRLADGSLHWVVSAYVLGYGGFMLLGGRTADILGRRRMFVVPLAVFVAFSGLGGIATEGWMLIVARFVTGVAAAFMTPAGLSIITTSFAEGPARNRALLIYSGTAAGGFTLGLVLGGLLTTISWRWVFFAPVLLALVILVAALVLLERDGPRPAGARQVDALGAVSITGAMMAAIYALTQLERPDGRWATIGAAAVAGAVLAGLFLVHERRAVAPLVRLDLLRRPSLLRADFGALLFIAATDGVAEDEQGVASGILYTATQFGAALGLAAVTVARGGSDHGAPPAELLDGFRTALLVPLAAVVLAAAVTATGLRPSRRTDRPDAGSAR